MQPPDQYFIRLTPEQEVKLCTWARSNWTAALPADFKRFHPVIRDRMAKVRGRAEQRGLGRADQAGKGGH